MDVEIELSGEVCRDIDDLLNQYLIYSDWSHCYFKYEIGFILPTAEVICVHDVLCGLDKIKEVPGVKLKGASGLVSPVNTRGQMKQKTPLEKALQFLDNVKETIKEKNKAYGDSAANPLRIFSKSDSDEAIKVRIDDKLSRIAKGDGSGNEDAVKDLVGYLALLAGMRK